MKRNKAGKKVIREMPRQKKLFSKAIFLLLIGLVVVAVILGGCFFLLRFCDFKIKEVTIINQRQEAISNPQDFFFLDSDNPPSLLHFDMERVIQDIQARHPEVASVSIHKQFPSRLLIVVKERHPLAIIAQQDFYLVDNQGFILPFQSRYRDLPKIVGIPSSQIQLYAKTDSLRFKKAEQLLKDLKLAGIYPEYKVSQIDVRQYSNVSFYFENGIEVKMGKSDFASKAAVLSKVLPQLKMPDLLPKCIDMRFGKPIVKP